MRDLLRFVRQMLTAGEYTFVDLSKYDPRIILKERSLAFDYHSLHHSYVNSTA